MSTPQDRIPVRYIGLQPSWRDNLYGSNVSFTRGKTSQVPAWAAAELLKHPEFEDARPKDQRGQPITASKPAKPMSDEEREELDRIESHVRIDTMTKDQMAAYAMRNFGVRLDTTDVKVDVTSTLRTLMRTRGAEPWR